MTSFIKIGPGPLGTRAKEVRFFGKLYHGSLDSHKNPLGFSVDELKELNIVGKPIWLEHDPDIGEVGSIDDAWVDTEGWLCIKGSLNSDHKMHEKIRKQLVHKELVDLSIHLIGKKDSNGRVIPESRSFLEASLTTQGRFEGTHLLSVAASQTDNTHHYTTKPSYGASLTFEMNTERELEEAISEIRKKHDIEISPDEIRGLDSLQTALLVADKLDLKRRVFEEANSKEKDELMQKSSIAEAERNELEEYRRMRAEQEKEYAAREQKQADEDFQLIADDLPESEREQYREALKATAGNVNTAGIWDIVKVFAKKAKDNKGRADILSKDSAKQRKEYNLLQNERDDLKSKFETSNQQAVDLQASMKRRDVGVDPSQLGKRKETATPDAKTQDGGEVVHEQASYKVAIADRWFPNTFKKPRMGTDEAGESFLATLDGIARSTKLKAGELPRYNSSHSTFAGFNRMWNE